MRLEGKLKGGFYAIPPETVEEFLPVLDCTNRHTVLDPCCGKGEALKQIVIGTGASHGYGVELEQGRGAIAEENSTANTTIIHPASFISVKATHSTFGLVWCNPPFDDEVGGGESVEISFLPRAKEMLANDGIMAFVVPEKLSLPSTSSGYDVCRYMRTHFRDIVVGLPANRPFGEVVIVARKRKSPIATSKVSYGNYHTMPLKDMESGFWLIPETSPPKKFLKGGLTDIELFHAVAKSELWEITNTLQPLASARPLLPLKPGHLALVLASGGLDGAMYPPNEPPHIVRGTAIKVKMPPTVEEQFSEETGVLVKTRVIVKEKIQMQVRTVDVNGTIKNYS